MPQLIWGRLLACLLLIGSLSVSLAAEKQSGDHPCRFGVFPCLSAARLESVYASVSAELSRALGYAVQFRTSSQFERFFTRLEQQYYDITLIQSFWYPLAVDNEYDVVRAFIREI